MKTLIATLIMSTLSLNVMAIENLRPELDTAKLGQEMLAQQQQASRAVVLDALSNLKPLALKRFWPMLITYTYDRAMRSSIKPVVCIGSPIGTNRLSPIAAASR